jgi:hypothetical protein
LPQSSPGTRGGMIGLMRKARCEHNHAMMFQQGHIRKSFENVDVHNIFSGEKLAFLDSLPKG